MKRIFNSLTLSASALNAFDLLFSRAKWCVIMSVFSSNIHRVYQDFTEIQAIFKPRKIFANKIKV